MYVLSLFSTVVLLLVLSLMSKVEREFISKKGLKAVKLSLSEEELLDRIRSILDEGNISKMVRTRGKLEVVIEVPYEEEELDRKLREIMKLEGVKEIEVI